MNILSLFDGISCGQIAFERAGIPINKYFSSEIDKNAIEVTQNNYPNTIQLGDVTNYGEWHLPKIDVLIGGSPCQDFSTLKKNRQGLNGDKSSLFYKYVACLEKYNPKYFLFENINNMPKSDKSEINRILNVEPLMINSNLVSAQNRERLYWTNIPNISIPKDKKIMLKDILVTEFDNKFFIKNRNKSIKFVEKKYETFFEKHGYIPKMFNPYNCAEIIEKSPTLTAQGCRISVSSTVLVKEENDDIRVLTPIEWERLQTLPDNYTNIISDTHRYNCVGNGWTVDIIAHMLKKINI